MYMVFKKLIKGKGKEAGSLGPWRTGDASALLL